MQRPVLTEPAYWRSQARRQLQASIDRPQLLGYARNAVLLVGPGLSASGLAAARVLSGQRRGDAGEGAALCLDALPSVGLAKTYCVDSQVAESACSATALLCGVKGRAGTLAMAPSARRGDCRAQGNATLHLSSLLRWAQEGGKATGVVTNGRVTQAPVAASYAHAASAAWESDALGPAHQDREGHSCPDVALQLVTGETGQKLKVVLGGGRAMFRPNTAEDEDGVGCGSRLDGRNLIEEWNADKYVRGVSSRYIWSRGQLLQKETFEKDYILGLFGASELPFHLDTADSSTPRLSEMTRAAITALQREYNGFILLVCAALMDKAHGLNLAQKALDETLELEAALQVVLELTNESDTLVVVMADHAHSLSFSGSPPRGNDIFGVSGLDSEGVPYTSLTYVSGPGYRPVPLSYDVCEDNTHGKDYAFPAMRPEATASHSGEDALVLSRGPCSHLLSGVFEQSYVPHAVAFATCVGDGATACNSA
ncbi:membrane-bound alkaline phosphatase-like [Schistocerca serialis cubense]|uniref:membrane-bound alkaline phosphatase-like n=1 Tax=Schistocerca serialis cubense TaxID=2023355 RepID=UPI00214F0245|nr:membrane-bound alkaline phosphatase-like [Schistocerca serialis cubense]